MIHPEEDESIQFNTRPAASGKQDYPAGILNHAKNGQLLNITDF